MHHLRRILRRFQVNKSLECSLNQNNLFLAQRAQRTVRPLQHVVSATFSNTAETLLQRNSAGQVVKPCSFTK